MPAFYVLESFRFNHNISAARKKSARMWGRYWNQKSFKVNALERHNMASLPMWRKPLFSSRSLIFASKKSSRIKDCIDFWDYSPFSGHENVVFHGGVFHNIQFFVTCVPRNLRTQTSPQNNILSASKDARINAFGMDGIKIESTDHCWSGNVYSVYHGSPLDADERSEEELTMILQELKKDVLLFFFALVKVEATLRWDHGVLPFVWQSLSRTQIIEMYCTYLYIAEVSWRRSVCRSTVV